MSQSVQTSQRKLYSQLVLGLLTAVFIGLGAFDLAGLPTVHARLAAAHLLPQPDRFTALSFSDQTLLPFRATGAAQPFAFEVANHEGQTMTYAYEVVSVNPAGVATKLDAGTLLAADGQTAEMAENVTLPIGAPRTEVVVELPGIGQQIHFWVGGQS